MFVYSVLLRVAEDSRREPSIVTVIRELVKGHRLSSASLSVRILKSLLYRRNASWDHVREIAAGITDGFPDLGNR